MLEFTKNVKLFLKVITPIYTLISRVWESCLSLYPCQFKELSDLLMIVKIGVEWYLIVA